MANLYIDSGTLKEDEYYLKKAQWVQEHIESQDRWETLDKEKRDSITSAVKLNFDIMCETLNEWIPYTVADLVENGFIEIKHIISAENIDCEKPVIASSENFKRQRAIRELEEFSGEVILEKLTNKERIKRVMTRVEALVDGGQKLDDIIECAYKLGKGEGDKEELQQTMEDAKQGVIHDLAYIADTFYELSKREELD